MTKVSRLALGSAVALALALGVAPAAMAKEKPAAAPASPPLSKEFRAAAGPAQAAITAKAWADALTKLDAADLVAKTPYEKFLSAQLRYQATLGSGDKAGQAKALDAMQASGGAPAEIAPALALQLGSNAYAAADYPRAIALLESAEKLGAKDEQLPILIADSYFRSNNVAGGIAAFDRAVAAMKAAGKPVPYNWYKVVLSSTYKAKQAAAVNKYSRMLVTDYPTQTNWRDALILFRDSATRGNDVNLDLFRLMHDAKALDGERDYFEYASLAFDSGLPGEAKAVVDEAVALGKAPAGSKALTEVRTMSLGKVTADRASLATSEKAAATSARMGLATADAYLAYGENAKAIALYQGAIAKGGIDMDKANMHLGIALLRAGQRDAAKAAFGKVNPTGPRGDLASLWLLYLDVSSRPAAAPAS